MLAAVYDADSSLREAVKACAVQPVTVELDGTPAAVVVSYDVYEYLNELAEDFRLGEMAMKARREGNYIGGPELMESMKKRLAEIDAMEAAENEQSAAS